MPAAAAAPAFTEPGPLATDTGHVVIAWQADEPVSLLISQRPDFAGARTLYRGRNRAYFLSGLAEGDYYLELRDEAGTRSTPLTLEVSHQSLAVALWLTAIGFAITLGILGVILRGAKP